MFTRFGRIAIASAVLAASAFTGVQPAAAAAEDLVVRSVDTRAFPEVTVSALLPQSSPNARDVKVTENGKPVDATVKTFADSGTPTAVALLIDASSATAANDTLTKEKAAAIAMVEAKAPGQKFAVIAYNTAARPVVSFTDDAGLLISGIQNLQSSGESALWDGLRMASALLQETPELQPNIVVVNASPEAVSVASRQAALDGLRDADAALFAVTVTSAAANEGSALGGLADETNGRAYSTEDPLALKQLLVGINQTLGNQAFVTYTSPNKGALDITLTSGTSSVTANASEGTLAIGSAATPDAVNVTNLGPFAGYFGIVLLGLIALAGVGLLTFVVIELAGGERNALSRALSPYNTDVEEERDLSKLADTDLIKRAVAETGRIAESRGFLETVEKRLEQAQIPLKPAEAIFFTGAVAMIAMLLGAILFQFIGLVLAGIIFAWLPIAITSTKAKLRRRKFTKQLPDTLQLLSGSLRAGYSLIQGIDAVAKQIDDPMGGELTRALSEARLGRPVEEALQEVSDRMQSDDFEWAVMAIKIQREVGGNLAELLNTVANTMVERERLRREVKALTAEGRMSAIILVALPPVIGGLISFMNPTYMTPMYSTFIGQVLLGGAVVMVAIGYWAMNKLVQIEA